MGVEGVEAGADGCGLLRDVVRHGSFDKLRTGSLRTPNRLTTNGVGHVVIGRSGAEVYR